MTRTTSVFCLLSAWLILPALAHAADATQATTSTPRGEPNAEEFARLASGSWLGENWGSGKWLATPALKNPETETGLRSGISGFGTPMRWGDRLVAIPIVQEERVADRGRLLRLNALGLELAGRFDARNQLSIGAQYGDYSYESASGFSANSLFASVGWAGEYGARGSRLGTSFFLGEESVGEQAYKYLGRRYFGLSVDGSVALFRDHTPFVSLKLQRSDYDESDPLRAVNRNDDYSRLAAGWDWSAVSGWRLRAEADRTTNASSVSSYGYDRSRVFFGTRFDFR